MCLLVSCGLETARPSKKQELVIASDFLNKNDLLLFRSFEEQYGVTVRLKSMSADSIHKHLKLHGYASHIDLVFLQSSLDFCDLEADNLLHTLKRQDLLAQIPKKYQGKNGSWFGLSIDPYVVVYKKDTNTLIQNYKDLLRRPVWTTNLREGQQLDAFYAGLMFRGRNNSGQSLKLIEGFEAKKTILKKSIDSLFNYPPLLTSYSAFYSDTSVMRTRYRKLKLIFPNQKYGGTLYELRAIGLVKQASNYSNALEFILYLVKEENNQRINNWWNTFPVGNTLDRSFEYQNQRFKLYSEAPRRWCKQHKKAKQITEKK